MAYLSRIRLNPHRRQARRFLRDPQALHAAVLAGIPTQPVDERVLWRLDADTAHRPEVLVLTQSVPSWEHLVEQAGWPSSDDLDDPQVLIRPYEPLLQRLESGQQFVFRLRTNPVVATKDPDRLTPAQLERVKATGRSVLVAHRTVRHQLEWLTGRVERHGFEIPPATASEEMKEPILNVAVVGRERLRFNRGKGKGTVTIQTATFQGQLVVTDPALLREAMTNGIGRARAYGCGLLTLAPVPTDGPS